MKRRHCFVVVLFGALTASLPAQWDLVDPLHEQLAADRIETFAKALGENDLMTLFRLLDPAHMRMNIEYYKDFSFDDPATIDFAIRNWGFFPVSGSPFLDSIAGIDRVTDYWVDTTREWWEVTFFVLLQDGGEAAYTTLMDPETLLMYGASG